MLTKTDFSVGLCCVRRNPLFCRSGPIAGKPAPTGIALGLTGVCHKVWQRLLERAPPARRNRELRSLLRLFRANYSCGIRARTPWCMPQYRAVQTRQPRAPVTGVTGPKQTERAQLAIAPRGRRSISQALKMLRLPLPETIESVEAGLPAMRPLQAITDQHCSKLSRSAATTYVQGRCETAGARLAAPSPAPAVPGSRTIAVATRACARC